MIGIKLSKRWNISYSRYLSKVAYYNQVGTRPHTYQNLGEHFEKSVKKYQAREILVSCSENIRLTYADALDQADRLANSYRDIGLNKGDALAIWAPNTYQWFITFWAAMRSGLIVVSINPALQQKEIDYCLKISRAKTIVIQESFKTQKYYDILNLLLCGLNSSKNFNLRIIVDSESPLPGAYSFKELLKINTHIYLKEGVLENVNADDICNMQFTSGTTGQPKVALLSHFNLINSSIEFGHRIGFSKEYLRIACQVPLFHVFGLETMIASISFGETLVVPGPSFDSEKSLKAIESEKCTTTIATPTMLIDNLEKQKQIKINCDSLYSCVTGASACSPNILNKVAKTFKLKKILVAYGCTECSGAVCIQTGDENDNLKENYVGSLLEHLEAKVVDSNGRMVNFGQPGELCIRGLSTMQGYYENEENTKEILGKDGWLKTGDVMILEENGHMKFVGRKKDIIVRGGENIFPKEIEDYLNRHPDVLDSQIIGIPNIKMGEEICAFIRTNNDKLSSKDLKNFCKQNMAHFKIPRYILKIDEFPKTTSGKVQKFKLKELFDIKKTC